MQVRSGGLRALAAALQGAQKSLYGARELQAPGTAAAALRAEENAPLVGHIASVLLQVRGNDNYQLQRRFRCLECTNSGNSSRSRRWSATWRRCCGADVALIAMMDTLLFAYV